MSGSIGFFLIGIKKFSTSSIKAESIMKIAMIGLKGIPAKWGGIEKYVEEVGKRLVRRGHEVTVFGSKWYCKDYQEKFYKGIKIVQVPALHFQATDALSNGFFACLASLFQPFDVVHFHNYASFVFVAPLRLMGKTTVVTAHGLVDSNWVNPKYNRFGHSVIRNTGAIGLKRAHCVTTVADYWKTRIKDKFKIDAIVLSSGIDEAVHCEPQIITEKYGLEANKYILFLGRIDPIKRAEWLSNLNLNDKSIRIVVAGGAQDESTNDYFAEIKKRASHRPEVIFTGNVVGKEKAELLSNCRFFVNPSSSEGLPITVLEAMSYRRCCLVSDIPAHREIIDHGRTGFLFKGDKMNEFERLANQVLNLPETQIDEISSNAKNQTSNTYNWDRTAQLTEDVYRGLVNG
jgi:glycosyltransferase involved in cell wall biosynthesis